MTQPIDRAFVDIEARTQDFSRDLNRDVEVAYAKVEVQTDRVTQKITSSFDEAGREIKRTFTLVEKKGVVTAHVLEESFDAAGDKIKRSFKVASAEGVAAEELIAEVGKIAADSVGDSFKHAGERIERAFNAAARHAALKMAEIDLLAKVTTKKLDRGFLTPVKAGFDQLLGFFGKISNGFLGFANSLTEISGGTVKMVAIIAGLVALTGPVIVLVGALADLVGLLGPIPASIGVLVSAIIPLVFAFQGLGDAIKAINEGDPKKIAEALKGLAPAARSVAKEIAGLSGAFSNFRRSIQQSFFAPIVGDIKETSNILMSGLKRSIDQVAGALGRLAENFLAFLQQPTTIKQLNTLFSTTARIIETLNVPLVNFLNTMLTLTTAGLPFVQRLADAFGRLLEKFAAFVDESVKSGKFNDFVQKAIDTTKKLFGLLGALGRLFVAVFGGKSADAGRDFIQTLTDGVDALTAFFKSAQGQKTLKNLIDNIKVTVQVVSFLFEVFKFGVQQVNNFIDAIKFASQAIAQFIVFAGRVFKAIGEGIATGFNAVVDFFQKLPGRIMGFLSALPGMIADFFRFLFDSAMRQIGIGIGLVLFVFLNLPRKIAEFLRGLPQLVGDFFKAAWEFAREKTAEGIAAVVDFVRNLPSRIVVLAGRISAAISDFFSRIFTGGKAKAKSALDAIVEFFKNLPSRLSSFVSDVGAKIGNVIKNLINRAIDKINEGIKAVDDKLPGPDLPRIPRLAKGAIVKARPGGVLANIAESGQDEIVGPLKDVAKLFQGTGGQTITFGPGSVVVTFEGVKPTAEEAFQTGQAVGQGIVATLTRRDVRTNVRSM